MADSTDRLRAALADRYRIERQLGAGGMATVYLAQDRKIPRQVAIKVLRPELAQALGPERFLREIAVTAQLDHPNILSLHDSGEAKGFLYYVMPYVEGETLRDRLDREKQLPLDDALQITREVADALGYAHSHGIVHRDIKPENILLAGGHARVADFGIARAVATAGGDRLTETGLAIGTPAYMSPEQASGEEELDGRGDIYSLGCVLYEMLLGEPPFSGRTAQAIIARHVMDPVPSIRTVRGAVPEAVEEAVTRALEKTPADRFPTAAHFVSALSEKRTRYRNVRKMRWVAVSAVLVLGAILGLMVPRRDAGPTMANPAYTILADVEGNADPETRRVIRALLRAVLEQTNVIRPVSEDEIRNGLALMVRPDTLPLDTEAARELAYRGSVRTVVTSSLDRVGQTYALTVRVVDAETGEALATERVTSPDEDGLIRAVDGAVRPLQRALGARRADLEAMRPLPQVTTHSFEAYRRFVQSLQFWDPRAIPSLREAVELDSAFVQAWVAMAALWSNVGLRDSMFAALRHAERHIERASPHEQLRVRALVASALGDYQTQVQIVERLHREYGAERPDLQLRFIGMRDNALDNFRRNLADRRYGPDAYLIGHTVWLLLEGDQPSEARRTFDSLMVLCNHPVCRGLNWLEIPLAVALDEWARAESLATAWENERLEVAGPIDALVGIWFRRGEVRRAYRQLNAYRQFHSGRNSPFGDQLAAIHDLLAVLVSGYDWPHPPPITRRATADGLAWRGIWEAVAGDTSMARPIASAVRDSFPFGFRGAAPELIEAIIAARGERWREVVNLLEPVARRGETGRRQFDVWVTTWPLRWLTAVAYERLEQFDSAAVWYEGVLRPSVRQEYMSHRGIPYPFARQRLVVLYARMGRLDDAVRHWEFFRDAFTNPDPEFRYLIDEAREALERAVAERGATRPTPPISGATNQDRERWPGGSRLSRVPVPEVGGAGGD